MLQGALREYLICGGFPEAQNLDDESRHRLLLDKEGFEVDFLARSSKGDQALIQVCLDLAETGAREREIRALLSSAKEHPKASLNVITLRPETARDVPKNIRIHDAAVWLLAPDGENDRP